MGKGAGKSPSNKIIIKTSKRWPWTSKMGEVLAQRTILNASFFLAMIHLPFKQLDHCEVWKST